MTAPLGSVTVPCTGPALPDCARAPGAPRTRLRAATGTRNAPHLNGMKLPPIESLSEEREAGARGPGAIMRSWASFRFFPLRFFAPEKDPGTCQNEELQKKREDA